MSRRAFAVRVYEALLRIFPAAFRDRYGAEMVGFFQDAWAEARGLGRARVVARAMRDAVLNGVLERIRVGRSLGRGRGMMKGVTQDLRFAIRGLRRRPGFAVVAVLTVALGIGAASAVFAVVDAVVFRPLPYPDVDRLVSVWTTFEGQGDFGLSLAEHYDYAEESQALQALGSFTSQSSTLTGLGETRRVSVVWTWGELYSVIGARAVLGRLPAPEDSRTGSARVAVISQDFWSSALGSDPEVIGRTLELDATLVEVVGVMEEGVRLPLSAPSIWRPIARDRADIVDRSGHNLDGIGLLAPGATLASVRTEIDEVHVRWDDVWAGMHSPGHPGHFFAADALHTYYFGDLRSAGTVLVSSILLVLLLACANVASLLLARGAGRADDLALRRALGAGRGRIVRQLLVESLVLSALGGLLGVIIANFGVDALMRLEPGNLPRVDMIGIDVRVMSFAVVVTLLSGLVFGVVPAFRAGAAPMRGGRRSAGPDRSLARSLSTLVVGQVALAIVLLAGAGLLVRSVDALASADAGVETENRLTFRVSIAAAGYPQVADINEFWLRLLTDVEALPGVTDAAAVRLLPLRDGLRREGMVVEGREAQSGDAAAVAYGVVTPGYFSVAGIPVVEGREFERTDEAGARWVGVVNEAAARIYWPDSSPIGREVHPTFMAASAGPVTIVGVVGDVKAEGVRSGATPELYLDYAQTPPNGRNYIRSGVVVVRTAVDPSAIVGAVRSVVERIDPQVPLTSVSTFVDVAAGARARERFLATVLGVFALLALVIAGMGTYGVVAYAAARRTREFGVRIAMGAARGQLVGDVLLRGLRMAVMGATLGVAAALMAAPLLQDLIFGVGARDPVALAVGPLVMGALVVCASVVPAIRASRVDPMEAFREEV